MASAITAPPMAPAATPAPHPHPPPLHPHPPPRHRRWAEAYPTDAVAVQRWKASGAVIFGKTNVPAWLADGQSFNAIYGTTNNPWDLTRTPGGSSGGSSAAIAAGLSGIETGSDAADIGLTIHPHPTLTETIAGAAEAFEGTLTDLYLPKKK